MTPGRLTFVNLSSGRIQGLELQVRPVAAQGLEGLMRAEDDQRRQRIPVQQCGGEVGRRPVCGDVVDAHDGGSGFGGELDDVADSRDVAR